MDPHPFDEYFADLDEYRPERLGFAFAIDRATALGRVMHKTASDVAASDTGDTTKFQKAIDAFGGLAQLWESPYLQGIPQKPSTLGQLLVLGTLGGLGGYAGGKLLDRILPNEAIRFSRAGAVGGTALGLTPGLLGGLLNYHKGLRGAPIMTSSFWNWGRKESKLAAAIDVQAFNDAIWNDPTMASRLPATMQAAASGLVTGASNLPGKPPNSRFVTPTDVARMAVGMGSGAASGWLVGKALGTAFGTSPNLQKRLMQTGALASLVKTVVPVAFQGI